MSRGSTKFDVDRFNRVFSENRMESVHDTGYTAWMQKYDPDDPRTLAKIAQEEKAKEMRLVKYNEPAAMHVVKGLNFEELGVSHVDDFSREPAIADRRNLTFTDYRVAHSTTKIIDPDLVRKRQEYKNVQELEKERANVRYEMNAAELKRYHAAKQKIEKNENQRHFNLKKNDTLAQEHYERVNRMLLMGKGTSG